MQKTSSSNAGVSQSLLETAFRHKKKLVVFPALVLGLAVAAILVLPRSYRSQAKIYLQVGRESVALDPTATTGGQIIGIQQSGRDSEVVSAIEVLTSRGLAEEIVDTMTPDYILRGGPAGEGDEEEAGLMDRLTAPLKLMMGKLKQIDPISPREEAIIAFQRSLTVTSERDSTVIALEYESENPLGAQELLVTLIEAYQRKHLEIHTTQGSQPFFASQRDRLKQQLDEANQQVRDAKNRMKIGSIGGRRSTLEELLRAIEQETNSTEQNLTMALGRVAEIESQLSGMPERMIASRRSIPNQGADLMREQLYELQVRQMDLKARYSDNHPLVIAIAAQVEEAEKIVDGQSESRQETTDDVNPVHRQLTVELTAQQSAAAGFRARLETLREQEELTLQDLTELNQFEVELDELYRLVSLARTKYMKYEDSMEQARINSELEKEKISSVSPVQAPTLEEKPVSPSKLLIALAGVMVAFGGSLSWVAASEQLNDRVRSDEQVEKQLGSPVLAAIPESAIHGRVLSH